MLLRSLTCEATFSVRSAEGVPPTFSAAQASLLLSQLLHPQLFGHKGFNPMFPFITACRDQAQHRLPPATWQYIVVAVVFVALGLASGQLPQLKAKMAGFEARLTTVEANVNLMASQVKLMINAVSDRYAADIRQGQERLQRLEQLQMGKNEPLVTLGMVTGNNGQLVSAAEQ